MTECNIFCYAEHFNNKDSFQQEIYRAFNKVVGEERFKEIRDLCLEIMSDTELKDITKEQIDKLKEIPEFDKKCFEFVTGLTL